MRRTRALPIAVVTGLCGAGIALAAHPTVDPAQVPTGYLAAHARVGNVPTAALAESLAGRRTDVFLQHDRLAPGAATGFRTHPGPVLVTVASGAVLHERAVRGRCRRRVVGRGAGLAVRGGEAYRLTAQAGGADFYVVSLLPPGTGRDTLAASAPGACGR